MQLTDKIRTKLMTSTRVSIQGKKKEKKKGKQATTTTLMFQYFKCTLQLYL